MSGKVGVSLAVIARNLWISVRKPEEIRFSLDDIRNFPVISTNYGMFAGEFPVRMITIFYLHEIESMAIRSLHLNEWEKMGKVDKSTDEKRMKKIKWKERELKDLVELNA